MFKFIAAKVLQYHGLEEALTAKEVAQNVTLATALKPTDGSFGGLNRRLRVERQFIPPGENQSMQASISSLTVLPAVKLNFYAEILVSDIKSSNGYLHTINHPLIPPDSIFNEAYLFPDTFSTLTSAVQGLDSRKYLEWKYDKESSAPGNRVYTGAPLVTLFAPTNIAFARLPPKLKLFLFSPFGEKALEKVLRYHYVPETLVLSELLYSKHHSDVSGMSDQLEYFNLDSDPSYHKEFTVQPALENAELHIEVDRTKVLPIKGKW